jgi:nucleoside-diphosphate-sugar epimerase
LFSQTATTLDGTVGLRKFIAYFCAEGEVTLARCPFLRPEHFCTGVQGDGKVSQIDLRDIAAVAVKTLAEDGHERKAYTLTGPEALSNARVAEILSEDVGREIRYMDLPPEQFKQALLAAGVPDWSANALIDLQLLYRRGGASAVTRDVEELLGRKPISFEQFSLDYGFGVLAREASRRHISRVARENI